MPEPSSRRKVLRATAGLAAGALVAGCVGQGSGADGDQDGNADADGNPTGDHDHDSHQHSSADGTTDTPQNVDDDSDDPTDPGSDGTATDTPADARGLVSTSFESVDTSCGEGVNTASVYLGGGSDQLTVDVEGVIRGPDGCQVAVLESVGRAPDDDSTVQVHVGVESEGSGVCTECIVDVSYRASFEFEGDLPGTVAVYHETAGDNPVAKKSR